MKEPSLTVLKTELDFEFLLKAPNLRILVYTILQLLLFVVFLDGALITHLSPMSFPFARQKGPRFACCPVSIVLFSNTAEASRFLFAGARF